jgi:DNA replication protein DnaC
MLPRSGRRKLSVRDLKWMRIPEDYWGVSLEAIPSELKYRASLEAYLKDLEKNLANGVGMILSGPYGCGKTSAAVIIGKEAAEKYRAVRFYMEPRLVRAIFRRETEEHGEATHDVYDIVESVPLLIIDDWGLVKRSEESDVVENLILERIQNKKASILTTNLSPDQMKSRYPTVIPRMEGKFIYVDCTGINWRERKSL